MLAMRKVFMKMATMQMARKPGDRSAKGSEVEEVAQAGEATALGPDADSERSRGPRGRGRARG